MAERCPTCGSAVKVVGKTTLHYELVGQEEIGRLLEGWKQCEAEKASLGEHAEQLLTENEALRKELQACTRDCQRVNATCEQALGLLLEIAQEREIKALSPDLFLRIHTFLESE